MASWWHIRLHFLECQLLWFGPLAFMVLLVFYARKKAIKSGMEYFCFSLALMTFLTEINSLFILPATVAILTMGYADSAAAILGSMYQKRKNTNNSYSLVGSITFFLVSTTVSFICLNHTVNIVYLIIISALVSLVEAKFLPKYDNITVPILTFSMVLLATYLS